MLPEVGRRTWRKSLRIGVRPLLVARELGRGMPICLQQIPDGEKYCARTRPRCCRDAHRQEEQKLADDAMRARADYEAKLKRSRNITKRGNAERLNQSARSSRSEEARHSLRALETDCRTFREGRCPRGSTAQGGRVDAHRMNRSPRRPLQGGRRQVQQILIIVRTARRWIGRVRTGQIYSAHRRRSRRAVSSTSSPTWRTRTARTTRPTAPRRLRQRLSEYDHARITTGWPRRRASHSSPASRPRSGWAVAEKGSARLLARREIARAGVRRGEVNRD